MAVRIGIIGAGNMGRNHIRLTREMNNLFDFAGVFDPDIQKIKDLGLEDKAFGSEEELIEKVDAVGIVAPSSLHKDIALKCAEKGRHALVEKPLALSKEDASEIVSAFEKTDKVLMVGHVERFNPVVIELEKILKNEDIVAVHIERCSSMDRRISDTDVIYDLMIHDIDILENGLMNGADVSRISAYGNKVYSPRFMDYVESVMQFEEGVVASVIASRTTEDKIRKVRIHCKNSYIDADLLNRTLNISRKTVLNLDVGYDPVYRQENIVEKVFISNEEPLKAELKHFHDCIVNGSVPKNNGASAVKSIGILDEIKQQIY